jgi:hypothetical protein
VIIHSNKGKDKDHPRTDHVVLVGEYKYNSILSLASALDEVGGQRNSSAGLPPEKTLYPLYRRLSVPQGRSGWVRKIFSLTGFDPRTVQPVARRYTD